MTPLCRTTTAVAVFLFLSVLIRPGFGGVQSTASPQAPLTPESAAEQLRQAERLAGQGKREEARKLYEGIVQRAHAEKIASLESRALGGLGWLMNSYARYPEARQYLEQALAITESAGDHSGITRVANMLGTVAVNMGQSEEAKIWYERAVRSAETAGDLRLKAYALNNLATAAGYHSKTLDSLREVMEISHSLKDKLLEAGAIHSWGDFLFENGDFAGAMDKLESAAALYEEITDQRDLARVYTSMGRLNRTHGRASEAISLYEKAMRIQQQTGDKLGVIQSLNATAVAYGALSQLQKAREFYEKAYALALETHSPKAIDFMRANLAGNLIDLGQYARSVELLEEVLRGGADAYPEVRHTVLAEAYLRMGRLEEARLHAEKGVELSAQKPNHQPRALHRRAEVRERQGDLAGALSDAEEAIRAIETLRAKLVPIDFMKEGFSGTFQSAYTVLISLYQRQGQPEKAIEAAELARGRAFLDLLATREVQLKMADQAEIADLRATEHQLQALCIDPHEAAKNPRTIPESAYSGGASAHLLAKLKAARPELLSFVTVQPQTAQQLMATAKRLRSTILCYWTAYDALYIGVIPPGGKAALERVEISGKRLASLVEEVSESASSERQTGAVARGGRERAEIPAPTDSWRELYRFVIQPVRRLLPPAGGRLTIIPHGPLKRLSFAALADAKGRYLLEDYALHYVPAGALLEFTAAKARTGDGAPRRYLLVADPQIPPPAKREPVLPPLPGAREEVRDIARLLPAGTATILEGPQADKQTVAASMSRASVLHFATHGITHDAQPLDSYLALGCSGQSGGNGRLTAQNIYGQDLHADLVVLSSCRSGGGVATGEGISAMARAFFYAGASSIMMSLLDVLDQPGSRLLPSFYASWLKGRSRVDALRSAQLQLLADLRAGRVTIPTPAGKFTLPEHPVLWAGLILLGEP